MNQPSKNESEYLLSQTFRLNMEQRLAQTRAAFGACADSLESQLSEVSGDERALIILALTTLPSSDACGVPFYVFRSYARHALMLRRTSPCCRDLPEYFFLQFVFYPRVNNEDIVDCRPFFYEELMPRVSQLSCHDAALEVNVWCAEHMTYQADSPRTENPLTACSCGLGRCGEESTLAVSAYRSIGIPARQVYVPLWAHCDDNHAWTEIYIEGQWHFLGACEPEPVLDRGWFTTAASRAPVVIYRTFWPDGQGACTDSGAAAEELINPHPVNGSQFLWNVTPRYAQTSLMDLLVLDEEGNPAPDVRLEVSLVNEADLQLLFTSCTDSEGHYCQQMGRGSIHIEAASGHLSACADISPNENSCQTVLTLKPAALPPAAPGISSDIDFIPPAVSAAPPPALSADEERLRENILKRCSERRRQRLNSFMLPDYISAEIPEPWQEIFRLAGGNAPELYSFYQALDIQERDRAVIFLHCLDEKDYRDTDADVLSAHFHARPPFLSGSDSDDTASDNFDVASNINCGIPGLMMSDVFAGIRVEESGKTAEDIYYSEILNPRISNEVLEDWRPAILQAFSYQEQACAVRDPQAFFELICQRYPDKKGRYCSSICVTPLQTLKMEQSDADGRQLLFVASMRTFGVPARLDPSVGRASYLKDGKYHSVSVRPASSEENLVLSSAGEEDVRYEVTFTLSPDAHLAVGKNLSLQFMDAGHWTGAFCPAVWDAEQEDVYSASLSVENSSSCESTKSQTARKLYLPAGIYRIITANRLPNGTQLCRFTWFNTGMASASDKNQHPSVPIVLRQANPADMLSDYQLDSFTLRRQDGTVWSSDEISGLHLFCYLDTGTEPTEHLLDEIAAASDRFSLLLPDMLAVTLILRNQKELKDPALRKTLKAVPGITVMYDNSSAADTLARSLFLEPDIRPLIFLTDSTLRGYYGSCGYQVSSAALALNLADCILSRQ